MNSIVKLIKLFSEFPGIGPRQAKRFVYFLLTRNSEYLDEFLDNVRNLKKETSLCTQCFRYYTKNKSASTICPTCSEESRDESLLMIVSRDVDFENVEKTGFYNGKYFVLGGSVPILEKEPEKKIRIKELEKRIEKDSEKKLKEIIFALNANPEGENTADYIEERIRHLVQKFNIKSSTLGRGLATGAELEYSDSETLKNALKNRQ
jgi:recombination protein RecR